MYTKAALSFFRFVAHVHFYTEYILFEIPFLFLSH